MWSKASVTIHNYWYSLLAEKPTKPSRRPNKPVMIDSYSTGLLRGFTRQIFTVMLYERTWLCHQPQCYLRWTGPPSYSKKSTFPTFWKLSFYKSDRGIPGPTVGRKLCGCSCPLMRQTLRSRCLGPLPSPCRAAPAWEAGPG